MTTAAICHTCGATIADYDGTEARGYVIVAPGETPPQGNYIIHVCPNQPPYRPPANRPRTVLDWTDEQERASVRAALPDWTLDQADVIFCMSWYEPGMRIGAAPTAPLTIQVRRPGTDLAFATKGEHFDEVSFTAEGAQAIAEAIGVEPWDQLTQDLAAAEDPDVYLAEFASQAAHDATEVWRTALAQAQAEADQAAAHAAEHPDDGDIQAIASIANDAVENISENLARAEAEHAATVAEPE